MDKLVRTYGFSLVTSLAGHALLFLLLFTTFIFSSSLPYVVKKGSATQAVEAVTVNEDDVSKEVAQLQEQQQRKKAAEQAHVQSVQKKLQHIHEQQVHEQKQLALMEKQKQLQVQRLAAIKKANLAAEKKAAAEKQHLKALKQQQKMQIQKKHDADDLLQQEILAEQHQLDQAKNQYVNGIVNKYIALIRDAIRSHWNLAAVNPKLSIDVRISTDNSGRVTNVTLLKSSGFVSLDRSAISAIYKTSPLPMPQDKEAAKQFRSFSITMMPTRN